MITKHRFDATQSPGVDTFSVVTIQPLLHPENRLMAFRFDLPDFNLYLAAGLLSYPLQAALPEAASLAVSGAGPEPLHHAAAF